MNKTSLKNRNNRIFKNKLTEQESKNKCKLKLDFNK